MRIFNAFHHNIMIYYYNNIIMHIYHTDNVVLRVFCYNNDRDFMGSLQGSLNEIHNVRMIVTCSTANEIPGCKSQHHTPDCDLPSEEERKRSIRFVVCFKEILSYFPITNRVI